VIFVTSTSTTSGSNPPVLLQCFPPQISIPRRPPALVGALNGTGQRLWRDCNWAMGWKLLGGLVMQSGLPNWDGWEGVKIKLRLRKITDWKVYF